MSDPWASLFQSARVRRVTRGSYVFRRGAPVERMYLVSQGTVRLVRHLSDGNALTMGRAGPGALLAEASLFAERYHCDALCEADATLADIPRGIAMQHLTAEGVARAALARSAVEVMRLRTRIEVLRMRRLEDRLGAYLDLFGPPAEGCWVAVADWIGVTPAALYRALAKRRRTR